MTQRMGSLLLEDNRPTAGSRARAARDPRQDECDEEHSGTRHCRYTATQGPAMSSCATVLKAAR